MNDKEKLWILFPVFFFAWKMTELIIKMAGFYFYNRSVG